MPKFRVTTLVEGIVLSISLLVMVGWALGSSRLVQIQPSFVPMQFNTALCFSFLSLASIFLNRNKKLSKILILASLTLALMTGLQYLFGVSIGIDELFIKHGITVKTSHPGRMAPNTSLCFVLLSLALFIYLSNLKNVTMRKLLFILGFIVCVWVFLLSLIAIIGYVADLKTTYSWRNLTAMAIHTAIGFFLLASTHLYKLKRFDFKTRFKNSKIILFLGVLFVLLFWQLIEIYLVSQLAKDLEFKGKALITQTQEAIYGYSTAIDRFFSRYERGSFKASSELEKDAIYYLQDMPSIDVIQLGETNMFPDGVSFYQKNLSDSAAKIYVSACQRQKQFAPNSRVVYAEAKNTSLICMYSTSNRSFFVINTKQFIDYAVSDHLSTDIGVKILHDKQVIVDKSNPFTLSEKLIINSKINFLGEKFVLFVTPKNNFLKERIYLLSNTSLVVALLLVMMLTTAVYFFELSVLSLKREKKIRSNLEKEEEKNRLILNYAGEGIYGVDTEGKTTFINPAANKMLGFEKEELIGEFLHELIHHTHPDGKPYPKEQCPIYAAFKDGQKHHLETEIFFRKNNSYFPVEYSSRPIYDQNKNILGAVVTFIDITDRKVLEKQLLERQMELESTNKELESFSYSVSHDLQAPLRHISAFVMMLKDNLGPDIDDDSKHYLDVIVKAAAKMGTLIEGLLNFSRAGRVEVKKELVNTESMVKEVIEQSVASHTGTTPDIQQHHLPDVFADPVLLRSIWVNLIENAIKFSSKSEKPKITIGCEERNEQYVFSVRDNGAGFDEKYKDKLFGVFQRLHKNEEFPGTGIGLANVARIIARHGGKVWAEGEINKGACIYFSVPKQIEGQI